MTIELSVAWARRFGDDVRSIEAFGMLTVDVLAEMWEEALIFARDELDCGFFDWLTAVDELDSGFSIVAHVHSLDRGHHLLVRTRVPRTDPRLVSATGVYRGANWHERETYEMFGVRFDGHPDLRPLLLPDGFEGHPLRKEFVLAARVAKPWPGAKEPGEPGEPGQGAPSRRRMMPPGVPRDWGPAARGTPPPRRRPGRRGPVAAPPDEGEVPAVPADEPHGTSSTDAVRHATVSDAAAGPVTPAAAVPAEAVQGRMTPPESGARGERATGEAGPGGAAPSDATAAEASTPEGATDASPVATDSDEGEVPAVSADERSGMSSTDAVRDATVGDAAAGPVTPAEAVPAEAVPGRTTPPEGATDPGEAASAASPDANRAGTAPAGGVTGAAPGEPAADEAAGDAGSPDMSAAGAALAAETTPGAPAEMPTDEAAPPDAAEDEAVSGEAPPAEGGSGGAAPSKKASGRGSAERRPKPRRRARGIDPEGGGDV